MVWTLSADVGEVFRRAWKEPLLPESARNHGTLVDRAGIEAVIPHRDPFLFLDRVTALEVGAGLIAARYDLARSAQIFAVHFPGNPLWPGVLHVEAIAQAAVLLYLNQPDVSGLERFSLTHILGARYMHPVTPGGDMEVLVRLVDHDLDVTAVGQCLHHGAICSVAAIKMFP